MEIKTQYMNECLGHCDKESTKQCKAFGLAQYAHLKAKQKNIAKDMEVINPRLTAFKSFLC